MTRKEVKTILQGMGVENTFSLRKVQFEHAARQVATIKNWKPHPKANEIKAAFRGTGVVVMFDPAKGVAFVSTP